MALAIDQSVTGYNNRSATSVTTSSFTTGTANELLIAFVMNDGFFNGQSAVMSISDSVGLTWQPLASSDQQSGLQCWYALTSSTHSNMTVTATMGVGLSAGDGLSISVVTFTGHNTTNPIGAINQKSAASGTPSLALTTVGANSWVWGQLTSQDNSTATAGSNQTVQNQSNAAGSVNSGGSQTILKQNATTSSAGTSVTMSVTNSMIAGFDFIVFEIIDSAGSLGSNLIIDNVTTGTGSPGAGGTVTVAHQCNGSNAALFVLASFDDSNQNGNQTSSVTYNGTSMTQVAKADSGSGHEYRAEIWYLAAPTTGSSQNVVLSVNNINFVGITVISFQNASQSTPTVKATSTTLSSLTVSGTMTVSSANSWVIGVAESQFPMDPTTTNNGIGLNYLWNQNFQWHAPSFYIKPGSGSKTFTFQNGSSGVAAAWCEVAQSGGAAAPTPHFLTLLGAGS